MSEVSRIFFIDSISSTAVQFRRHIQHDPEPKAEPTIVPHQVNIITGDGSAVNADTTFYAANCTRYEITIRRLT